MLDNFKLIINIAKDIVQITIILAAISVVLGLAAVAMQKLLFSV